MSVDLRGFTHPAERLGELARWRLTRAERRLAQAQSALDQAQRACDDTAAALDATVRAMTSRGPLSIGGEAHALHANRVVGLLDRQRRETAVRDERRAERDARERICMALRQRVQGLDKVHAQALGEFGAEQALARWRELDDHVITRTQWLATRAAQESRHAD